MSKIQVYIDVQRDGVSVTQSCGTVEQSTPFETWEGKKDFQWKAHSFYRTESFTFWTRHVAEYWLKLVADIGECKILRES